MNISSGSRLGPYEIIAPLGAGGMGEVYRARDTRLERSVAIKILPAELAGNAQLKLRFEREAKTISQLNHPNICTLYDVGDGYLVMELLEGESLADRVARGPLPIEEVFIYGIQIAEALDKAHRQGVTHRDLKPGNVMLTKSGAKLLDFGLAKSAAPLSDLSGATQQKALTQEGTIVGTFQYMAPEQLEGEEADARTDIFALGALLYEMATGKRAFAGKTRTSLIAAIVSGRPEPLSQVQPLSPPALEHVIERCLEKDPADRWQSTRDVAEELKWIAAKGSQAGIAAPIAARRRTRERLSWMLHLVTAAVAVAATWTVLELRREPPRLIQSTILPPENAQFAFDRSGAPALSPDGKKIVFPATTSDSRTMLFVRPLSGGTAQPLSGTEDGGSPFWSPDSRSIGFFVPGKLKRIDASGGPPQTIADAPQGRGGTWSQEGLILFAPSLSDAIMSVPEGGGAVTRVTNPNGAGGDTTHRYPWFLPDGRHFLYMTNAGRDVQIFAGSIGGGPPKKLVAANSNAIYSSGYLFYLRERSLVAQRFDPKTLSVGRDAVPVAENIAGSARRDACFTLSPAGTLVYQAGSGASNSRLVWVDRSGKPLGQLGKEADYSGPSISHDGRRVAVSIIDPAAGQGDIWIEDSARATRLTFDPSSESNPSWSPDDSMILYTSNAKSPGDIMAKRSSGTGGEEVLYASPAFKVANDWSPDGKRIAYMELAGKTSFDLWFYSPQDHQSRLFLQTPYAELAPRFSPDGKWISYHSNESGRNEVYVLPTSGNSGKWQISTEGGERARWSRDGREIFYQSRDYKLMAVDVSSKGSEFIAGVPHALFPLNVPHINGTQYDVAPDGKRFLVNTAMQQAAVSPFTLMQNVTAALGK